MYSPETGMSTDRVSRLIGHKCGFFTCRKVLNSEMAIEIDVVLL